MKVSELLHRRVRAYGHSGLVVAVYPYKKIVVRTDLGGIIYVRATPRYVTLSEDRPQPAIVAAQSVTHCAVCGAEINGRGKTCSDRCRKIMSRKLGGTGKK